MTAVSARDVEYHHGRRSMRGYFCAPAANHPLPGVLLIHDAWGLGEQMIEHIHHVASLGFAVLGADVWGNRHQPESGMEIGPLLESMTADRDGWLGLIRAAHEALTAQPEVDSGAVAAMGFCFGGSSALEHLRTGGKIRAAVAIHAGLDLLDPDWSSATPGAAVLVCTGADDPMATQAQRGDLERHLDEASADWQIHLYSNTKHAFTSTRPVPPPMAKVVEYNAKSAARAWAATDRFLVETLSPTHPTN